MGVHKQPAPLFARVLDVQDLVCSTSCRMAKRGTTGTSDRHLRRAVALRRPAACGVAADRCILPTRLAERQGAWLLHTALIAAMLVGCCDIVQSKWTRDCAVRWARNSSSNGLRPC
jgi:hypothetical protein